MRLGGSPNMLNQKAGGATDHAAAETEPRSAKMTRTTQRLPAETGGTDITRFNALRHGVLSRARGYLTKTEINDHLLSAVEALASHRPYLSERTTTRLAHSLEAGRNKVFAVRGQDRRLHPRGPSGVATPSGPNSR